MTEQEIKQYLEQQQEETKATLWGSTVKFKPYLLEKIFGDGMTLIYFGTLDDRPYWWLVRVDSHADDDGWENFDSEEIYQAIEEECGCHEYDEEADVDEDGYDKYGVKRTQGDYPEIESDSSPHWGIIADLAKGVDKYGCPLKLETKED